MPELPDVDVYIERIGALLLAEPLVGVRLGSPFVLRSVRPRPSDAVGRALRDVRRLGKRVVLAFDGDLFFVIHLMIAGRLRWRRGGRPPEGTPAPLPGKRGLAAFDFPRGTLLLTEEGSKKRASLHVVEGEQALEEHDPGGIEISDVSADAFAAALRERRHTLKRALTDPRILAGIGNAYSDEILLRARLSPFKRTDQIGDDEIARLLAAAKEVLGDYTARLRAEVGDGFPEKVTAFRPDFGAHGRFGEPCPQCGTPIQRLKYADNEANYCPTCQTGGKLLADRGLSRLLKDDWPRSLEELEAYKRERRNR